VIGVVIATHGRLAEELLRTAEGVVGPLEQTRACSAGAGDGGDGAARLLEAVLAVDQGDGVVLLTDLLGGSPTNLALGLLKVRAVEVITGVNLPMLMKLVTLRASNLGAADLARQLALAGQKAIVDASSLVRGKA
jgi:PTS system mannose-specific IIA component